MHTNVTIVLVGAVLVVGCSKEEPPAPQKLLSASPSAPEASSQVARSAALGGMDTATIERLTGAKGTLSEKEGVFKVSVPRKRLAANATGERHGEGQVDGERIRDDRAIDDIQALVHRVGSSPGVEHLTATIDDTIAR